ncbi:MAG: polyphenol oxidase family protein [Bacillota bacterium]
MARWAKVKIGNLAAWRVEGWDDFGFSAQFVTRRGGVSERAFASLNPAAGLGDDSDRVRENRNLVAQLLPGGAREVQILRQVHGTTCHVIGDRPLGKTSLGWWLGPEGDALIGENPAITLATFHADCLPVYVIDPSTGCRALIHAGWRGLLAGVIQNSVDRLLKCGGGSPHDLHAALGPSIERDAYEVGPEVLRELAGASFPWRETVYPGRRGRGRFDLARAAAMILRHLGLPRGNLVTDSPGTFAKAGDFYSYRRDGATGRCVALLSSLAGSTEE